MDPELFIDSVHMVYLKHKADSSILSVTRNSVHTVLRKISARAVCKSLLNLYTLYQTFILQIADNLDVLSQERFEKYIVSYIFEVLDDEEESIHIFLALAVPKLENEIVAKIFMAEYTFRASLDLVTGQNFNWKNLIDIVLIKHIAASSSIFPTVLRLAFTSFNGLALNLSDNSFQTVSIMIDNFVWDVLMQYYELCISNPDRPDFVEMINCITTASADNLREIQIVQVRSLINVLAALPGSEQIQPLQVTLLAKLDPEIGHKVPEVISKFLVLI